MGALRYAFPRALRLLKTDEFSSVFSLRVSSSQGPFQVLARPNGLAHARLGLVVGKRTDKRAVVRNYLKRSAREAFRLHAAEFGGFDFVVRVRERYGRAAAMQNREILLALMKRAARRCAPS
ncbi:Ribonuclease P protein component [Andreprevotia sp. IGB-42]|uniref:ribonuclease P protein component n=1 Tax=Andreprevotia sp. IGB-42 TaxID=2497473 RepID=UPI00135AAE11|nr:ribonuclease P protein component [Andreprevotia sp. IGB-42]KAF0812250.1 Ribonuclease P protein component [Andreprevotia sp. IGB-42]